MQAGNFAVTIIGQNSQGIYERREDVDGYVRMAHGQKFKVRIENHGDRRCSVPLYINGKHQGTFVLSPRQRPAFNSSYGYYQTRGGWRSDGWFTEVERAVDGDGHFTAYARASAEGAASGAGMIGEEDGGVISVTFQPELIREVHASVPDVLLGGVQKRYSGQGSNWTGQGAGPTDYGDLETLGEPVSGAAAASGPSWKTTTSYPTMDSLSYNAPIGASANRVKSTDVAAVIGQSGQSDQKFNIVAAFDTDPALHVGPLELRLVVKRGGPRPLPGHKAPPPLRAQ